VLLPGGRATTTITTTTTTTTTTIVAELAVHVWCVKTNRATREYSQKYLIIKHKQQQQQQQTAIMC
jgi:hypothetical protein